LVARMRTSGKVKLFGEVSVVHVIFTEPSILYNAPTTHPIVDNFVYFALLHSRRRLSVTINTL
jgi:hypothetical protein